jgi:hypothetical protein
MIPSVLSIGWREWIGLPDLSLVKLKAKIDTGAKTSVLQASIVAIYRRDGILWVDFLMRKKRRSACYQLCTLPVQGLKQLTSSNGVSEWRPMVTTCLTIGNRTITLDFTLAKRPGLLFPCLIGRQALQKIYNDGPCRFDPTKSYQTRT